MSTEGNLVGVQPGTIAGAADRTGSHDHYTVTRQQVFKKGATYPRSYFTPKRSRNQGKEAIIISARRAYRDLHYSLSW